jgi:hypothetical protein
LWVFDRKGSTGIFGCLRKTPPRDCGWLLLSESAGAL